MFNFVTKNFNLFVKFVYNFTSKICHKNLLTNSFQGNFQCLKELNFAGHCLQKIWRCIFALLDHFSAITCLVFCQKLLQSEFRSRQQCLELKMCWQLSALDQVCINFVPRIPQLQIKKSLSNLFTILNAYLSSISTKQSPLEYFLLMYVLDRKKQSIRVKNYFQHFKNLPKMSVR